MKKKKPNHWGVFPRLTKNLMHFRVKFIDPLAYSSNTNQSAKVYTN